MNDKPINEKESLAIITDMIARTKKRYSLGDGNIMLLWGYLTLCISLLVYLLLRLTNNPAVNWLWFLIWIIGGIATPIMAKKESAEKGHKTYTDRIISRLWSTVGYSAIISTASCLFLFLAGYGNPWSAMFIFALTIVPFAEIANGIVLDEKPLVWGGLFGLAIGIFVTGCVAARVTLIASWIIPLLIIAFVMMMIIPGHIINYKAKHSK